MYSKMLFLAALMLSSVSCRSFEKRTAEAGFEQTLQSGSFSQSYDCTGPAGCGSNVGRITHNTQNVQNHATQINQQYNQGSRATNFSHGKKKRSAEADAKPGFKQTFQDGSHAQNFDCTGPAGCGPNVGGFTFNTQNVQNHADHFNQEYNGGSRATNFSHGKKKRSAKADAEPGFVQTFQAGSHSQSFDCTGIAGCGQNVGGFTFNTQNVQNHADHFNQEYNGGSRATNFSHGKK